MVCQVLSQEAISRRRPLSQEVIDDFKRERVALALSAVVHDAGLRGLTVSALTKQAKMARNTFYELFANRQAAVRFALAMGNGRLNRAIEDGAASEGEWPKRVESVIERLLDAVVDDRYLAELCLVHGRCIDGPGAPFDPELVQRLAGVLRTACQSRSEPDPGPRTEELVAYGTLSVIAERLRRDEAESLRALAGELSEVVIHPFRRLSR